MGLCIGVYAIICVCNIRNFLPVFNKKSMTVPPGGREEREKR